jgi:hypothetical protein
MKPQFIRFHFAAFEEKRLNLVLANQGNGTASATQCPGQIRFAKPIFPQDPGPL